MLVGVNPWSAAAAQQGPTWLSMFMLLSLMPKAMHGAHMETSVTPGKLRASADTAFASGDLEKAVRFLSQAIQLEPENERNHYKRYRAHLRARRYKEALQDLTSSINLDPSNPEKLRQRAKLYVMMGRCRDAADDFRKLQGTGQADSREGMDEAVRCSHSIDEAERLMAAKHWGRAKEELDHAIAATEVAPDLLLKRAVCYFHLGDYYAATADSGRAIKLDSGNVDALALRASAYYQLGEFEMAQTHYREALKFDPEHTQCKEGHRHLKKMLKAAEKGKEAADRGQHKEAIEQLKSAVAQDPEHKVFCAPLWVKISKSHQQLKELGPAKQAAEQALRLNDLLEDAHITLSDVLIALEDFDEAVRVLKQAGEMIENSQRLQEALQKAEIAQKQSKEINYYKVLDVERNADTTEIKRAYRTLAKLYHPDKQDANQSPEDKEKAEREFLKIAQAYEVLSDEELRAKYDRGEDVSGRVQQQDAGHNPFGGAYHFGNAGGFGGGGTHFRFHFG